MQKNSGEWIICSTNREAEVPDNHQITKQKIFSHHEIVKKEEDFLRPTYSHVVSQIPDEHINKKTIGFIYLGTDCCMAKEGPILQSKYAIVERV